MRTTSTSASTTFSAVSLGFLSGRSMPRSSSRIRLANSCVFARSPSAASMRARACRGSGTFPERRTAALETDCRAAASASVRWPTGRASSRLMLAATTPMAYTRSVSSSRRREVADLAVHSIKFARLVQRLFELADVPRLA